ncbi:hypothetical protein [Streptomyces sp. G45]|uniref:hypothetical protein n=1 Tax=Streptomyces sp. G45 TaxID=3406627 RepID=UPI003C1BE32F
MTAEERGRAAEETVATLRTELTRVGITLPSLRVDPLTMAAEAPYPLVELGRCNLDTAMRLAAALREVGR